MRSFKVTHNNRTYIVRAVDSISAVKRIQDMTRKEYLQTIIEEFTRYIENWNSLTPKEKRDIGISKSALQQKVEQFKNELNNL